MSRAKKIIEVRGPRVDPDQFIGHGIDQVLPANDERSVECDLPTSIAVAAQEIALLRSFLLEEIYTILDIDKT